MKKLCILILSGFIILSAKCQVVITYPALPLHNQPVTITFNADQGDKGLMNYAGDDAYAHTGVITDKSTDGADWKYVKAEWNVNTPACKLVKLSANEYQLTISPSIREYYGVRADDIIQKMAFVFRNGNTSKKGRDTGGADIFVNVYEAGLQVSFIQPAGIFAFTALQDTVPVQISANEADSVFLLLDDVMVKKLSGNTFDTAFVADDRNRHRLVVMAKAGANVVADTAYYMVPGTTVEETIPAGIEDGITYPANDSVIYSLYAPGKELIYLIGDFNNWMPDSIYQLKKDGDYFWIALGNLIPGKEYAFQYLIDGEIRLADAYAEKILDPYNDKYIPETVYPNMPVYPDGKTQGIAGIIQPGKAEYSWGEDVFVPPAPEKLVIYELLIRDFVSSHDIKDVADTLDYLQTLGVNAVELMPFSEFEGNNSWGYNPSFYFAPDKYYGTDTDIKDFIRECHSRGMAVIMDIVLNHAYGQNPMVRMYFNSATGKPAANNPWFNENSPNTTYSWGYDFNHQSVATQYFVDRVLEYWLTEYKVDGFRFDFTKGFTNTPGDGSSYDAQRINILKRIYDRLKSVNHNAYMICEHFAPNSEEEVLSDYGMLIWGNSNYNYNEASMGYLSNSDFSWSSYKARGWGDPHLVSYMESHDEERLMFKNITYGNSADGYNIKSVNTALQRNELAGVFFFAIPGPKMIWQFGELGYDVSIDAGGRVGEKPVKWEYYDDPNRQHLYLVWAKMLDLRKKYPVFHTTDFTLSVGNGVAAKKIMLRHADGDAIVVGNFGLAALEIQPGFTATGWWYEAFSGDSLNITDVSSAVTLNAGEYRVYTMKKLESEIIVGNSEVHAENSLLLYPNPVADRLYINTERPIDSLEVFSISGVSMAINTYSGSLNMLDVSGLPPGFYLIRAQAGGDVMTGRFVKR